jgi:hypothetical protein
MRLTAVKFILLAVVALISALAPLPPALAGKAKKITVKPTGACAQSSGRCVSDCDQFNWCTMYICSNGQSTPVPFWRCYEPSGLCLAPRC